MKIVNIWNFSNFCQWQMPLPQGKDEWQMPYPSGTENWQIPHPIPGGTLGDSLDTSIIADVTEFEIIIVQYAFQTFTDEPHPFWVVCIY